LAGNIGGGQVLSSIITTAGYQIKLLHYSPSDAFEAVALQILSSFSSLVLSFPLIPHSIGVVVFQVSVFNKRETLRKQLLFCSSLNKFRLEWVLNIRPVGLLCTPLYHLS